MGLWQRFRVETVVDDKVKRGAEIGNVALESLIRIDGDFKTIQIQAVVRLEQLRHVGVFVPLDLAGGEALCLEICESLVAHGVEHIGRMPLDQVGSFGV